MANPLPTLVQIDNDGRWTATPRPLAEADRQALQTQSVADFAALVRSREASAIDRQFDTLFGLPDGPDYLDDVEIGHPDVVDATRTPVPVGMGQGAFDRRVRTEAKDPHDACRGNETHIQAADDPGVSADR